MSYAPATETQISWKTLRKIITSDIAIQRNVIETCADVRGAVDRANGAIAACENLLRSMDTLERLEAEAATTKLAA